MEVTELIKEIEKLGFEQQPKSDFNSFMIVVNNCRETKYYFRLKHDTNNVAGVKDE